METTSLDACKIERTRKWSVEENAKFRYVTRIVYGRNRHTISNKVSKHRPSTINYERHFSIYVSASEPGLISNLMIRATEDTSEERRARSTRREEKKTVNRE